MERIHSASVNQKTKPSAKAFYFRRSECRNGNLMLTPWLWVSCYSTRISEYREQEANFFGILSFGQGPCCLMPEDLFLAFPADKFLCPPASFSHSCKDYLMPQLCFILLFYQRGSLLSIWLGLCSFGLHSKPLPVGTSSFPPLSAPRGGPLFYSCFSFPLLTFPPLRRAISFSPTDLLFILCLCLCQVDLSWNPTLHLISCVI